MAFHGKKPLMFVFKNIGNTCYMNTALQCLFRIQPLNDALDRAAPKVGRDTEVQRFFHQFNDLRVLCLQHGATANCCVAPHLFLEAVQTLARHKNMSDFSARQQNDVAEFMQFVLNSLHEAMAEEVNFDEVEAADPITVKCRETMKQIFGKQCSEIIMLFYGMQVSTIRTSHTPEPFLFLDLPIPEGAARLDEVLNAYTAEEKIEGWFDESTKTTEKEVTRELRIWRLPAVLTLVLKRFGANGSKNRAHVNIPLTLEWGELTYTLQCVGAHQGGSLNSGHYVSRCCVGGTWGTIDDEMAQPCPDISVDAYCLVYVAN